jgi:uncharacterized protein YggE
MKRIVLLLLLAIPALIAAQVRGNVNYRYYNTVQQPVRAQSVFINDSIMVIDANILMNQKADAYIAIFSLVQVGNTLENVNNQLNERILSFTNELIRLGIRKEDIVVDMVSQVPIYTFEVQKKLFSKSAIEVPVGYELKKNVHVKYYRNEQLDALLISAAKYEIYDLAKVDYIVNNLDSLYDIMRKKSTDIIHKKTKIKKNACLLKNKGLLNTEQAFVEDSSNINITSDLLSYMGRKHYTAPFPPLF